MPGEEDGGDCVMFHSVHKLRWGSLGREKDWETERRKEVMKPGSQWDEGGGIKIWGKD